MAIVHAFLTSLLGLVVLAVQAEVSLNTPLSAQLPNIGHPNQPYSWTFSSSTFTTDLGVTSRLLYEAVGLPGWVTFDEGQRIFTGTPGFMDTGKATIMLVAKEEAGAGGSQASSTFDLMVLSQPEPMLNTPLAQQLPKASSLGPTTIMADGSQRIPHGWSFSIGFDGDTFTVPSGSNPHIDARLDDGSSLPAWLHFDEMTLWGQAPTHPSAAESRLQVVVTASNREGFGGPSSSVILAIGPNELSLAHPLRTVNTTAGTSLHYTVPITGLQLSGHQVPASKAISAQAGDLSNAALSWLSFDATSMSFSGTSPFDAATAADMTPVHLAVPITFTDSSNNTVSAALPVDVYPSAFTTQLLPNVFVDPGESFTVSLTSFLRVSPGKDSVTITASYDPPAFSNWFEFNDTSLVVIGRAPSQSPSDHIQISFTAKLNETFDGLTSTASFYLAIKGSNLPITGAGTQRSRTGLSQTGRLALLASLGAIGGLLGLILLMVFCRRCCAVEEDDLIEKEFKDLSASSPTTKIRGKSPAGSKVQAAALASDNVVALSSDATAVEKDESMYQVPLDEQTASMAEPAVNDHPLQNGLFATLWGKRRFVQDVESDAVRTSDSAHALGHQYLQGAPLVPHSRSHRSIRTVGGDTNRPSSRESRHSWANDLWYADEDARHADASSMQSSSVESYESSKFSTSETLTQHHDDKKAANFMRHRSAHLHDSPAFRTDGLFQTTTSVGELDAPICDEDHDGSGVCDVTAVIHSARHVNVRSLSGLQTTQIPTHRPSVHESVGRNFSQHAQPAEVTEGSIFDDAEIEDDDTSVDDNGHGSVLPRWSYSSQVNWNDRDAVLESGASSLTSDIRPEDTMRIVTVKRTQPGEPQSPVPASPWLGGGMQQRSLIGQAWEQEIVAHPGEFFRIRVKLNEPPPMYGGAPGSPGKRSGRRVTYVLHYEDPIGSADASLPEWLHWDSRMYELSGTIPNNSNSNQRLATPSCVTIAIYACPDKAASTPSSPSPSFAAGKRTMPYERTKTCTDSMLSDGAVLSTRIKLWVKNCQ